MKWHCPEEECGGGSQICQHGNRKRNCVPCGGAGICEHKLHIHACRVCSPHLFCEHDSQRRMCKVCGIDSSFFCEHRKQKQYCWRCDGSRVCKNHCNITCCQLGNPKYDMYCTFCFPKVFPGDPRVKFIRMKKHEIQWVHAILASGLLPDYLEWEWDEKIYVNFHGGCCDSLRRLDLFVIIGNTIIAIEIDENQHKVHANTPYENNRYNDLFMTFSGRYVFLRINPDPYKDVNGEKVDPTFEQRFEKAIVVLKDIVDTVLAGNDEYDADSPLITVHHMFYDGCTSIDTSDIASGSGTQSG